MDLGKYGLFIWGSYAITAIVFAFLIVSSLLHARRWKRRFEERSGK